MSGGNDLAGQFSILCADPREETWLTLGGHGQTVVGDKFDVGVGDIGEGLGGSSGISARHIGDAVVQNALLDINRIVVGGGAGSLCATALINGDVNQDTARAHPAKHGAGDEFRGFGTRNKDRSNEKVDMGEEFVEVGLI